MATRGRKPLPKQKKRARGTEQPCRDRAQVVEFPHVDQVPKPPDWLDGEGKELWNDLAPMLYAQRILTKADVPALVHMCSMHAAQMKMRRAGVGIPAAEVNALRAYFSEFGMTPSSRTKVAPASNGKKDNPFAKNGSKPKASAD